MRYWLIIFAFITLSFQGMTQSSSLKIGRLVYRGGGDWYANPTSLPNLIKFTNQNLKTSISKVDDVDVASEEIFNYPFIHMTGHGNVVFNGQEIENLRNYLLSGGFLHIDESWVGACKSVLNLVVDRISRLLKVCWSNGRIRC